MKLDEQLVAVVAGGASGLGEATVRALREAGAAVALLDRDVARGEQLAAETGAAFVELDVGNEASVLRAFAAARALQGQERVLIHTPAIGGGGFTARRNARTGEIERHDFGLFERIVNINLNGSFLCASIAAAGMMALEPLADGERGVIVLTSSIVAEDPRPGMPAYVASKAAVNGLAKAMTRDLGGEGIRVNSILPGSFDTPMVASTPDAFKAEMVSWVSHPKRFGEPREYASLVMELIRNNYLNGAALRLDGGAVG
jgi:NAD(P)-dependent dehydrogenase (short-subunit alcohol dehydrogenase family)